MQLWFPLLILGVTVIAGFFVESMARPSCRALPSPRRCLLDGLLTGTQYGMWLALCGAPVLAAALTTAVNTCLVIGSNIKLSILGEPMLFCDVVAARGFLQHPKFYLFSIPPAGRIAVVGGLIALPLLLVTCSTLSPLPHLMGTGCLIACVLALRLIPAARWAPRPDMPRDIGRLGLPGSLFLYWRRWRHETAQTPIAEAPAVTGHPAYDTVIVIQCESFACPTDLFSANHPSPIPLPELPALPRARRMASRWGTLDVSGFGAYTMRTEYGVLFGVDEKALGFRAYDPFLTARKETALSLPAIMGRAGYECTFVHPHDLRFYGRAQLMPACGFSHIIGEESFTHTARPDMPYVEDVALAQRIGQLVKAQAGPGFIYAVSMENHGPWPARGPDGPKSALAHYFGHLRNSDRMLDMLMETLSATGRTGLLLFFGDHRPSIAGMVVPAAARGTPYVMVPFGPGRTVTRPAPPQSLTPAQLHDLLLHDTLAAGGACDHER
ncbi:LTA synthase family protein [Komagataeibacter pomaceti]|nr:LTA synthase family protein [Novacetimonas pomaceti]